jgi:hypothetical protein
MLKEKTQYEFDKLHETVNEVFNVRMLTKSRERKNINARICFAHLLVDRGYSKSEVARYMEKNHATIIHYCRSFYGYLKSDAILRERYEAVSAIYNEEFDSVYIMDKERLKKEVFTLRQEISDLNCTIQQHEDDLEVLRSKASRMASIHDLVSQRTHRGKEEEIEKKLNTWFNGVYS